MQVSNNVQSPNFGMALRINKNAQKALKELPFKTIEELQKAGEELKDTAFYHVGIFEKDGKLSAALESDKDAYFGLFKDRNGYSATRNGRTKENGKEVIDDRIIMIARGGDDLYGVARYLPQGETTPFYNTWGLFGSLNSPTSVSHLAKVAKLLDGVAQEKYAEKEAQMAKEILEKEKVVSAVDNLMDKFGV